MFLSSLLHVVLLIFYKLWLLMQAKQKPMHYMLLQLHRIVAFKYS